VVGRRGWKDLLAAEYLKGIGIEYDGRVFKDEDGHEYAVMDSQFDVARSSEEAVELIKARFGARKYRLKKDLERQVKVAEIMRQKEEEREKILAARKRGQGMVNKADEKLRNL
jgi:hypothetical protein